MSAKAIAKIVSGYSGDPDTRGNKRIEPIGNLDKIPVGALLYEGITGSDVVVITQDEYDSLMTDHRWLCALEAAGVDNWQGIDEARDQLDEWDEEAADD